MNSCKGSIGIKNLQEALLEECSRIKRSGV
jgi:hypothetical protein